MTTKQEQEGWGKTEWERILMYIKHKKCTPFLGAGTCAGTLPLGSDIAQEWAKKYDYPLESTKDLAKVAQFSAVEQGSGFPQLKIKDRFESIKPPDFDKPGEPHGILADLPFPVYITTNYDDFMVLALQSPSRKKEPEREICRWANFPMGKHESIFKREPDFEPSDIRPLVYHLHGHIEIPDSIVITEDDYLDFMVNVAEEINLIPKYIQGVLKGTALLFLGYSLADMDFRVLFRSLLRDLKRSMSVIHVSVQLAPKGNQVSDPQIQKMKVYLKKYFKELNVQIYWGTCEEFVKELSDRWRVFNSGK